MASEGKSFLLRAAIFAVLGSLVTTVIYLTPVPEIEFASCERPCHPLMWPMICRVKMTVELYQSMSRACGDCPSNSSDCFQRGCVPADGFARGLLTVDRQLPGPTINVCAGDILLVDVVNRAPGHELAVHWRGQSQRESPMMDGVPMVTQCPIASNTIFQYKFRASSAGTHLYQAFTGSPAVESVFGALVVRQPEDVDPHAGLYDEDRHVVLVSEWRHGPGPHALLQPDPAAAPGAGALLFNGRTFAKGGMWGETLSLRAGRRHRLRLALAGGGEGCAVRVWAERHALLLVELDGAPLQPREVASLTLSPGERADVVLRADQRPGAYWLRATTVDGCAGPTLRGAAVLRYEGSPDKLPPTDTDADADAALRDNDVAAEDAPVGALPAFDSRCAAEGPAHCPVTTFARQAPPDQLTKPATYLTLALPFGYKLVPADNATAAGLVVPQRVSHVRVPHVNNITFVFPSSPVLTQPGDVDSELLCNEGSLPYSCAHVGSGGFCQCMHVVHVPLGATVELLLINQGGDGEASAVLHMHGYRLYVVGAARLKRAATAAEVLALDRRGALMDRELSRPVPRDTVAVPALGVVAARFKADNPGYWLLHEERPTRWAAGLAVLLHVGADGDTPAPPTDWPKCGSFVGPHFFLI
ncbi:hypothetical protein R5R35_006458 [Gryllus longicercus]|uniref:Uncharacterized protein n=1 Tax=Gryllus longicercus TaxID=2509291 RepID=A0AAN9W5E9_9ORTH